MPCESHEPPKVVVVVGGLAKSYGGPSYSVPRLCAALAANGAAPTLLSVARIGDQPSRGVTDGYRDHRFLWDYGCVPVLSDLRKSSGLTRALRQELATADIVHNHGIWLWPNIQAGREAARARKAFVVSPRGMLSQVALQYSSFRKKIMWHLWQGALLSDAACLHATSEMEFETLRALGLKGPVAVIPNGVDLPPLPPDRSAKNRRTVLSLGRVHPKKALERLVRAWASVEPLYPQWRLRIVGPPEENHDDTLRQLAQGLGLSNLTIEGPLYGAAKIAAFREADLFVLPSLNENFGLTVGEALAASVPVIATKGAPWRGLEVERCGWWIDHGVEPLAHALRTAMESPPSALAALGNRGRNWMERDFSWESVARKMCDVYRWLAQGGPRPATVRGG